MRRSNRGAFRNGWTAGLCAISSSVALCWAFSLFAATSSHAQSIPDAKPPATAERTKIAEGEYAIYEEGNAGAFGPLGDEVYDFHESWILWGNEKKQYRIEGERTFESPRYTTHKNRFTVDLTRDLTVTRLTESTQAKLKRESGPLSCEFLAKELQCSSEGQSLRVPMESPFAFLWPVSPFSLTGLTRASERDTARPAKVQLLSIEQPYPAIPVHPMVLSGELQYLGEENIEAAEQNWTAYKFSLKVAMNPQILLWTSTRGLLLQMAIEHAHPNWPKEGMRLIRFKKWAEF